MFVAIIFSGRCRVPESVHAIDDADIMPALFQECAGIQKPKGFYPKIVCGKIGDPGIDKKDIHDRCT